jgi:hypothetical protein
MARYTWPTGTTGGAICTRDIVDRVGWMRKFRGANVYPVVTLADVFMNTRFGGRQRPHFNIVKWVSLDGGGALLTPTELPALESPPTAPPEVKPPSAKEATDDEIKF